MNPRETRVTRTNLRLQYVGFSVISGGREYSFHVAGEDDAGRTFRVRIGNAHFLPGRLKYQEGPDISYRKLRGMLEVEQRDSPLSLRQTVTESDVTGYTEAGSARPRKPPSEHGAAAQQTLRNRLR